jgi:hypothetical protein
MCVVTSVLPPAAAMVAEESRLVAVVVSDEVAPLVLVEPVPAIDVLEELGVVLLVAELGDVDEVLLVASVLATEPVLDVEDDGEVELLVDEDGEVAAVEDVSVELSEPLPLRLPLSEPEAEVLELLGEVDDVEAWLPNEDVLPVLLVESWLPWLVAEDVPLALLLLASVSELLLVEGDVLLAV